LRTTKETDELFALNISRFDYFSPTFILEGACQRPALHLRREAQRAERVGCNRLLARTPLSLEIRS
jgi:hypothetical protein